jgi:ubiquitin C-terminal hydrolase
MFGLRNINGSCWINAALQAVFRIPDLQQRFNENEEDTTNPIEACLSEVWGSKGEDGLKDFYACVRTTHMPAGEGIGDSHELIEFLSDKVPFLDKLMRFKIVNKIQCSNCPYTDMRPDSLTEFSISPSSRKQTVSEAIGEAVQPLDIPDWECEKCTKRGCTKQMLLAEFPQVMIFHQTTVGTTISYTPMLVVNKQRYALLAVVCFTGGHWFTWGRDMPPGQPWYRLDDTHTQSYAGNFFPLADSMRLLVYYRLNT